MGLNLYFLILCGQELFLCVMKRVLVVIMALNYVMWFIVPETIVQFTIFLLELLNFKP